MTQFTCIKNVKSSKGLRFSKGNFYNVEFIYDLKMGKLCKVILNENQSFTTPNDIFVKYFN